MSERPDCFVTDLSKSVIFEVKAAEIVHTTVYPTQYTLRFPRVLKIRYDKPWNEAMTRKDLEETYKNF